MQCDHASATVAVVREYAHPHAGVAADYEPLMELVGNARVVLLGQASYGTHEFSAARARITRCLIEQKGFGAVAIAADWADASRINRYVQGGGHDYDALAALDGFRHFPTYTWRNAAVIDFIQWLRATTRRSRATPQSASMAWISTIRITLAGPPQSTSIQLTRQPLGECGAAMPMAASAILEIRPLIMAMTPE